MLRPQLYPHYIGISGGLIAITSPYIAMKSP